MTENGVNREKGEKNSGFTREVQKLINQDSSSSHGMLPARSSSSGVSMLMKQYKEKERLNLQQNHINGTMELLNEKEQQVSKDSLNEMIVQVNDAYTSKEGEKLAQIIETELLPFVERLESYIGKALA